jgi:hypothetical protein
MRSVLRLLSAPTAAILVLASPSAAQVCGGPGYPLGVTAIHPASLDSSFLAGVARSFAFRWQVPSQRRREFSLWRRVRNRVLPPEPRWADDGAPAPAVRVDLLIAIRRNGRLRAGDLSPGSGDEQFDESLATIASDPLPGAPDLPPFPAGTGGDSVIVRVTFGGDPEPGAAVVRFAAQQTPVRIVPGTFNVTAPRTASTPSSGQRSAVLKYDVTDKGTVPPGSIQVLESSDREYANAIRDGLIRAQFQPATSNCRAITMTVLQRFGP